MPRVVAILDVGKTNKKLLVFDSEYHIVEERSARLEQIKDEDGFPCEDLTRLNEWVRESINSVARSSDFQLSAVNATAYGASLVHVDRQGKPLFPLYDYLKPYPAGLAETLYDKHGGMDTFCLTTASPALGNLNSGLQLYRLLKQRNEEFTQVHYALHLPQYITWLLTGVAGSDITSIGCHTGLWDFSRKKYHDWVRSEGIEKKLAPIRSFSDVTATNISARPFLTGAGLHDSSAALVPYFKQFREPFLLLSTGTWNISLNPFNGSPLSSAQLAADCLCYIDFNGNPVKASRLFAGNDHELQLRRIANHFQMDPDYYKQIPFDPAIVRDSALGQDLSVGFFHNHELSQFRTFEQAYHFLIYDLVLQQTRSTQLVLDGGASVARIFVDGGFSSNPVFMHLLADSFPEMEVYAATIPHATAIGAALAIHHHWNTNETPSELINLVRFHPRNSSR